MRFGNAYDGNNFVQAFNIQIYKRFHIGLQKVKTNLSNLYDEKHGYSFFKYY